MEPSVSNLVLAKICLIYLLFDDFQHGSPTLEDEMPWSTESSEDKAKGKPVGDCDENHGFDHLDTWDEQSEKLARGR